MAFWDDLMAAQNNWNTFLGQQTQQIGKAFGAPQIDTRSPLEATMGPVSQDELNYLTETLAGGLDDTQRESMRPYLEVIKGGGPNSRDLYTLLSQGITRLGEDNKRNQLLTTAATNMKGMFDNDPLLKTIQETITGGMTKDVLNQGDISRLANLGNETLAMQSKGAESAIRENAANRGIFDSGGAIGAELMSKANYGGEIAKNTTGVGIEAKKLNEASKANWGALGTNIATLKGNINSAAESILAGQTIPSLHLDEINANISALTEQRKQLDYVNQTAATGAWKDILNLVSGGVSNTLDQGLSLLGIIKSGNKGSSGPSSSSILGGEAIQALGFMGGSWLGK